MVNDPRTGPPAAALMSLNMPVETEGRNYTPAEYGAWLGDLGCQDIRTVWFEAAGARGSAGSGPLSSTRGMNADDICRGSDLRSRGMDRNRPA
jgi:hypothetical protein